MSLFPSIGRIAVKCVISNGLLQRRFPLVCSNILHYSVVKVNADDLRDLPEKPKKPLTAYFRFMADMRPVLKKENPDSTPTDLVKLMADRWDKYPLESKQKYLEDYKKEFAIYSNAKTKYAEQLTDEQKALLKRAREEIESSKENRKLKKKMKELGKPRKPAAVFVMFFNTKVGSRGEAPYKEWLRGVAKEWTNLPPEMKSMYQKEYSTAYENHRRQVQEWEERMIRMGHIDVVRSQALIDSKPNSPKIIRTRLRRNKPT